MAQRVRDKLWRQASFGRGPGEVLLVAAADDKLVLAPLVEVAVAGRAVVAMCLSMASLTYCGSGMSR